MELERLPDHAVQPDAAAEARLRVERLAHQRVREGEAVDDRSLNDEPRVERSLDRRQRLLGLIDDRLDHVKPELLSRDRRRDEHLPHVLAEPPDAPPDDLAHALGVSEAAQQHLRRLARVLGVRGGELPGELGARNGLPPVASWMLRTSSGVASPASRAATSPAIPISGSPPSWIRRVNGSRRRSASRSASSGAVAGPTSRCVPTTSSGAAARSAHQVAQEQRRRLVGPVQVVDDQQQRPRGRRAAQRRGDRLEQLLAVGRRVGRLALVERRAVAHGLGQRLERDQAVLVGRP